MQKLSICYLHVGMEKTGSTTIQRFLSKYASALLARGRVVSTSLGVGNNTRAVVYAMDPEKAPTAFSRNVMGEISTLEAFYADVRQSLEAEVSTAIAAASSNPNESPSATSLVVSSELIHSQLRTVEELHRLKILLLGGCDKVRVILYLRRQDKVAVSLVSTDAILGGTGDTDYFPHAINDAEMYYFDYKTVILNLVTIFGKDNVNVRLFEKAAFVSNDLIVDFCDAIGVGAFGNLVGESSANQSIDPIALEVLQGLNRFLPYIIDGAPNPARKNIGVRVQELFPGNGPIIQRQSAYEFCRRFNEGNRWIRSNYFPDVANENLFDPDFSMYPEYIEDIPKATGKDYARIFAELWRSLTR